MGWTLLRSLHNKLLGVKMRVLLILLCLISHQVNANSSACTKDSGVKTLSTGLITDIETNSNGNWIHIRIPENIKGFSLVNTEIVIGNIEQPKMIFALKVVKRGNEYLGNYYSKEVDNTSKIYATYGNQCGGVRIVQSVHT